jgi:hypothetical protein
MTIDADQIEQLKLINCMSKFVIKLRNKNQHICILLNKTTLEVAHVYKGNKKQFLDE